MEKSDSQHPLERQSPTRGKGLIEPFLAWMRARKANQLIPDTLRRGRILDIGCGSYPYFLSHTSFKEKYAIDQLPIVDAPRDVDWLTLDFNSSPEIPYNNGYFSVITLLAVAEHLNPDNLIQLYEEVFRTLEPGGRVVITTPAVWSSSLLDFMARVGLVSKEEIDEHTFCYTLPLIGWCFGKAGFRMENVRFGYFELWMNLWATAEK